MSTVADRYTTPIFDKLKAETPELELPTAVGLTYEECVEHATTHKTEPKGEEDGTQDESS